MKNIKNLIILILAIFGVTSCGEWLNLKPEDGVIRERYWQTKEEARAAVNGCYASLMENDMVINYFIWGEMRADFVEPTTTANEDILDMRNGEITSSNRYTKWDLMYRTINQCNTVIELAPKVLNIDMSFSEKALKQYLAEAVCIRSLAYFYLLRTFRDVPYVTKASIYDDQDYIVPKMPQAQIEDSLVACLKKIDMANDLPFSYSSVAESKGRFTAWGLKALLADIYLWKGDYQECINLCLQIINSGQFSLIPTIRTEILISAESSPTGKQEYSYHANATSIKTLFDELYVKGNSVESIFELQFSKEKPTPFYLWFQPGRPYLQQNINVPTEYFITSSIDRSWFDIRGTGFSYTSGGTIWKWAGFEANSTNSRLSNEYDCNWIFYRLGEIYLMYAEALTQQALAEDNAAKLEAALEAVRKIRVRGNATDATDLFFDYTEGQELDGLAMEEFILYERARELSYEGKRWFDVLRHARRNNYAERNLNYLLKMAMYCASLDKISTLQTKWSTKVVDNDGKNLYGSHYLPINLDQIKANKKLIQNEFYKDNIK